MTDASSGIALAYWGSLPASLIILPHLSTSTLRNASSASGVARSCSTGVLFCTWEDLSATTANVGFWHFRTCCGSLTMSAVGVWTDLNQPRPKVTFWPWRDISEPLFLSPRRR